MRLETGINSAFVLSKNMVASILLTTTDQKTWDEKAELPHVINNIANYEALHADERDNPSLRLSNDHSFIETIQGCVVKDYKSTKRLFIFPGIYLFVLITNE